MTEEIPLAEEEGVGVAWVSASGNWSPYSPPPPPKRFPAVRRLADRFQRAYWAFTDEDYGAW